MSLSDDQLFIRDLGREDDVGLVLRGHLHIEHQLMEIGHVGLPFAERCDWGKFTYRAKVELAYGYGLPHDVRETLIRIGSLRNDFAHNLSAEISKKSALDLYNSLSERHRKVLKGSYLEMERATKFSPSALEPRDLVTLVFVVMRQAVKAAGQAL